MIFFGIAPVILAKNQNKVYESDARTICKKELLHLFS